MAFENINPCGFTGLQVTQAKDQGINLSMAVLEQQLAHNITALLQQQMIKKAT